MAPALSTRIPPAPPLTSWNDHPDAVWPVVLSLFFETLAIIAIVFRFYSHRVHKHTIALHDYFILSALFFSTILVAFLITAVVAGGLGQHSSKLSNPTVQLVIFAKIYVANSPIWACAISSVKISILLLYHQLFRTPSLRKWCYFIIGMQTLWCVAVILESLLLCQPLAINWDPTVPGHCGNTTAAYLAAHCVNLVLDIAVAIAPIPVLWQLQMKLEKKIGISLMFALGLIICIITIARIVLIKNLVATDITYTTVVLFFFTILEPLLGIVLASLPMTRALVGNGWRNTRRFLKNTGNFSKIQLSDRSNDFSGGIRRNGLIHSRDHTDSTNKINTATGSENYNFDSTHSKIPQAPFAQEENSIIHVTNTWDVQRH